MGGGSGPFKSGQNNQKHVTLLVVAAEHQPARRENPVRLLPTVTAGGVQGIGSCNNGTQNPKPTGQAGRRPTQSRHLCDHPEEDLLQGNLSVCF